MGNQDYGREKLQMANQVNAGLLSIPQAAARSGLSRSLLRRYCQQGRIGSRIGGRYVISADELDSFVKVPRPQGYPKGKARK